MPILVTEGSDTETMVVCPKTKPPTLFTVIGATKEVILLLPIAENAVSPIAVTLYSLPSIVTFQGRTTSPVNLSPFTT
jgi:hypothetical protein